MSGKHNVNIKNEHAKTNINYNNPYDWQQIIFCVGTALRVLKKGGITGATSMLSPLFPHMRIIC